LPDESGGGNVMKDLKNTRGIALEGGGVRGLAYQVPVEQLHLLTADGLPGLRTVAGTSVGGLYAALIALSGTPTAIQGIIEDLPMARFAEDSPGILRDLGRLWSQGGFHKLDFARQWISDQVVELSGQRNLTFQDLERNQGVRLILTATNESRGGLQEFSPSTTPDVAIRVALLATMAIPLYYPPVKIDGELFCDGGLLANHPVDLLAQHHPPAEVVGLRVDKPHELAREPLRLNVDGVIGRALRLYHILNAHAQARHVPKEYWPRMVRINTGRFKTTDFNLNSSEKRELYEAGDKAWTRWRAD
jgi:NTE family protein